MEPSLDVFRFSWYNCSFKGDSMRAESGEIGRRSWASCPLLYSAVLPILIVLVTRGGVVYALGWSPVPDALDPSTSTS